MGYPHATLFIMQNFLILSNISVGPSQIRTFYKYSNVPVADFPVAWSNVLRHIVEFQEMPVFAPIPEGGVSVRRLRSFRRLPRSSSTTKIEIKFYS